MALIDKTKTVEELYGWALAEAREIDLEEAAGRGTCANCGASKAAHLNDGRCNVYSTSRKWANNSNPRRAAIERACVLIEELVKL